MKEAVAAGYDPEVIDLISLKPFDQSAITVSCQSCSSRCRRALSAIRPSPQNSVKKTHRVIIVEECMRSGGIGASVSSWISENLLEELDHEVIRLSSQDVPTAYAKLLEDGVWLLRQCRVRATPLHAHVFDASLRRSAATIVQAKDVVAAIKKICH